MKLRRAIEGRDPADDLDQIRRELLRVVPDLADVETRCDAHADEEAALNEKGIDQCLDGVDPAVTERERAEFDRRKIAEERERDRLRAVDDRLRQRGMAIVEDDFRAKEQRADEQLVELRRLHSEALSNAARLEQAIASNGDRFDLERARLDALSEFSGKKKDWAFEDQQTVRRLAEQRLSGVAGADPVPARLQARVEAAVEAARSPARREAEQRLASERLLASGAPYVRWPGSGDPSPKHLGRLGR